MKNSESPNIPVLFIAILFAVMAFVSCITETRIKKYQVAHPELCAVICPEKPPVYVHDTTTITDTLTQTIEPDTAGWWNFLHALDSASFQARFDSLKTWYDKHPRTVNHFRSDTIMIKAIQFVPDTSLIRKAELKGYTEAKKKYEVTFDYWKLAFFSLLGLSVLIVLYLLFRKK